MNRETFTLDLGDGTRVTARINVAEIASLTADKLPSVVAFNWEGPRDNRHWPRYVAWLKAVWQHVADLAGKSFCSLINPPQGEPFFVIFEPHMPPETVFLPQR